MSDPKKGRKLNPIFLLNDTDPAELRQKSEVRDVRPVPLKVPKAANPVTPSPFGNKSEEVLLSEPDKSLAEVSAVEDKAVQAVSGFPKMPAKGLENISEVVGAETPVPASEGLVESVEVAKSAPVVLPPPSEAAVANPFLDTPVAAKRQLNPMFKMGGNKPKAREAKKVDDVLSSGSWDDDDSETKYGLGAEYEDEVIPQYGKGFHLTDRDIIIMRFLARYRYAYKDQLARLVDTTPKKIYGRLRTLEERGFIRKEPVSSRQYLWTTRKAGNELVDIPFKEIRKGSISYSTIAHTIGLVNLAVEFERESGGEDLLGEGKNIIDWVQPENRWKNGLWWNSEGKVKGEMVVTEREIRQGQTRWRGGRSVKQMRDLIQLAVQTGSGVELEEGQEGMFVVYGLKSEGGEHVPDMVIAREADPTTLEPRHIAIELELTPKTPTEWKRILRNYRDNGIMYDKIYYFTHKQQIANSLKTADAEVGLGDRLVIRKYVPSNPNMPFWG